MALTLFADRQYTAPSAADGVLITPNSTAWANSAFVELLAATPSACLLTGVILHSTDGSGSSANYDVEIDIATGAAGAEVVITTVRGYNRLIFAGGQTGSTHLSVLPIPVDNIGSGARVAARVRKAGTSVIPWRVAMTYLRKPITSTLLTTAGPYKTLPAAAVGAPVTAGSPAWANGAWGQLRAASGAPAVVVVGLVLGNPSASVSYEVDLGTGTAGAETVITTIRATVTNEGQPGMLMLPLPLDQVAAATRLAARLRAQTASVTMTLSAMVLEKPL